jgi:hypothetical protein
MKFELITRLAAVFTVFLHSPLATAQEAQVSLKLDLVAWGSDLPGLTLKSGGKAGAVTALAFRYSKPVAYAGPAVLEIHQSPDEAKAATDNSQNSAPIPAELAKRREKDPTIVALANLPPGSKRATVLIAPASGGTYQTFVIDDDPSKLPFGQLRIHNYSPLKVMVRCNNKESKELKIKDSFVVAPQDGHVIYDLAYDNQGKWKIQENNIIAVTKDEQVQFIVLKSDAAFFVNADGSRSGFLQTVVLRRSAKEPEPEPAP